MSRSKKTSDVLTREKEVKVGRRVIVGGEPQLLVGPEKKKDLFTLQDMTEALYGEGARCHVEKP